MHKALKVRLYPTPEQCDELEFQFGAARWVYNYALEWRSTAWKERQENVTKRMTSDRLVTLKQEEETAWLSRAYAQVLQQSVAHLDDAYKKFFEGVCRYPKFKSKRGEQSISFPQNVWIVNGNSIRLPKVGVVRAKIHRVITGEIKTVTVSRNSTGKYFASVLMNDGEDAPEADKLITEDNITGVDMGLAHLVITSEGEKQANPRFLKQAYSNLRKKNKSLSRKMKGSANRRKARVLLAKAHERVANTRNDFQHKLSKRLVDESQAVCVETLKVKNMLKNRRLSKAISDASWGEFIRKLEYKSEWYGKHMVKVDQWFPSSKTCSSCDEKVESMPLSVRHWTCESCGTEHDRDINAALNIKKQGILKLTAEGLSVSACGGMRQTGSTLVLPAAA